MTRTCIFYPSLNDSNKIDWGLACVNKSASLFVFLTLFPFHLSPPIIGIASVAPFVSLMHQISARMKPPSGKADGPFYECIRSLLVRLCSEFPFHTLSKIFALKNMDVLPDSTTYKNLYKADKVSW